MYKGGVSASAHSDDIGPNGRTLLVDGRHSVAPHEVQRLASTPALFNRLFAVAKAASALRVADYTLCCSGWAHSGHAPLHLNSRVGTLIPDPSRRSGSRCPARTPRPARHPARCAGPARRDAWRHPPRPCWIGNGSSHSPTLRSSAPNPPGEMPGWHVGVAAPIMAGVCSQKRV